MKDSRDVELLYDRECPVCEFYCRRIDVANEHGSLQRIDARDNSSALDEVTALGLDIDEGMVVRIDGDVFYGSEAIHQLATVSAEYGLINRISRRLFGRRRVAQILYPILAFCRNLLLKLLGRSRINNLTLPDNDRF